MERGAQVPARCREVQNGMEVITQEPSTARQVPAFDIHLYNPKRSRHALVIPVINEGERIRRQLRMIADVAPPSM